MLALRQEIFGTPSSDLDAIDEIINNPSIEINSSLNALNKNNGNFYVFPEINNYDFVKIKLAIKIQDFSIKATINPTYEIKKLDKNNWEEFWQLFNLIQEFAVDN
jgi:hypothetical protein